MRTLAPLLTLLLAATSARASDAAAPGSAPPGADPSPASADDGPSITLEDVLRALRERSPVRAVLNGQERLAEAEVADAGVHPNPTLSWGMLRTFSGPDTLNGWQHQFTLQQPVLIAGQRGARQRHATLDVSAAHAGVEADALELSRQARHLFTAVLAAEERLRVLTEIQGRFSEIQRIVVGRAHNGAGSDYDTLRLSVEQATLTSASFEARSKLGDAQGQLAVLLGLPELRARAVGELVPRPDAEDGAAVTWQSSRERLANVRAARLDEQAARAGVSAAEREAWPTPTVGLGVLTTTEPTSWAAVVGVSVPLPLFDRAQGVTARARAQADQASHTRQAVEASASAELERAERLLTELEKTLADFEQTAMSHVPQLDQMAADSYVMGGRVLELLDALRTRRELELRYVELREAVAEAQIDARASAGLLDR